MQIVLYFAHVLVLLNWVAVFQGHSVSRLPMEAQRRAAAATGKTSSNARAAISQPKSHQRIDCARNPEGIYRCTVSGKSAGIAEGMQLLLWMRPVKPAGDGWYLQKGTINGIHSLQRSGNWTGVAQVGNLEWPPHEGDTVELALTMMEAGEAQKLLNSSGVTVQGAPAGDALAGASSNDVKVHLQ